MTADPTASTDAPAGGVTERSADPADDGRGPVEQVDDPADPRLDLYRNLNDRAARRGLEDGAGVFVVEGKLAVARLLASRYEVVSLLVDDHQLSGSDDLVGATRRAGAPVYVGTRPVVEATVGFALHRGVVALARRPVPSTATEVLASVAWRPVGAGVRVVAVLEGLNDHENIGALFRNAAAFAVSAVLLDPTCADPLYRRSVRVSMGHLLHVPFARLDPWPDGLSALRDAGFLVAALAPRSGEGETCSLAELRERDAPVALLLGAEGPGLSPGALDAADVVVPIPMADGVDSLNVATAAAVAFHALTEP